MGPLTISDIDSLRANAEPLSTAVAAYTSSDSFKSTNCSSKPSAWTLSHHFSVESRTFFGSALKKSANQILKPRIIPLGTGRPTADLYPWDSVTFRPSSIHQQSEDYGAKNGSIKSDPNTITKQGGIYDLARGLNYGHAAGSQALLRFMTEHVEIVHNPPYKNWGTCLSSGSTSALEVALRIFCNRGDTILTERYTYPGLIEGANLVGVRTLGIEIDAGGLMPDDLRRTLRTWDESQGPRPATLYTIPSGQNPTGATQSMQRKQAIYQVAEEYDLIVIEDDPYYFLRTDLGLEPVENSSNTRADDLAKISAYLAALPPSFLALDRSGRVVRLDSVSKILAPGLRAGWVTAGNEIIDKFISYYEVSTVAVSGPSQLMLWDLLEATWGHLGFFSWLDQLSMRYRNRLRILLKACDSYLPKDICEWVHPQNGMFLWIGLNLIEHPSFQSRNQKTIDALQMDTQACDIEGRILSEALENGVQITKGSLFDTNKTPTTTLHFRLTYAAADVSEIENGVRIFARAIREEFGRETIY